MHAIAKHIVEFTGADGRLAVAQPKQAIVLKDEEEFNRLKALGAIIPTTKKAAEESATKPTPAGLLTEATAEEQQTASEPVAKAKK